MQQDLRSDTQQGLKAVRGSDDIRQPKPPLDNASCLSTFPGINALASRSVSVSPG